MAPLLPRSYAVVPSVIPGGVAVATDGEPVALGEDGILSRVGPNGYARWSILLAPSEGPPALDERGMTFVAGRDERLYAVDPAGFIRWNRALPSAPVRGVAVDRARIAVALENGDLAFFHSATGVPTFTVRLGHRPAAAPVFTGAALAAVPTIDGLVVVVDPAGASSLLRIAAKGPVSPLAAGSGGEIYAVTSDGKLVRAEPASGRIDWCAALGDVALRSPVIDSGGNIVVTSIDAVHNVGAGGTLRWRQRMGGSVVGGPVAGDDGSLYVAVRLAGRHGAAGEIVRLDADGRLSSATRLPAAPTSGVALGHHVVWLGLADRTLTSVLVPTAALARSPWPRARGGAGNAGSQVRTPF